jgi:hypothetical protein
MTTDAKEARKNENTAWCTTRCGALQESNKRARSLRLRARATFSVSGVFEKRLKRKLTPRDFTDALVNQPDRWKSDRLMERLGHKREAMLSATKTPEDRLKEAQANIKRAIGAREDATGALMEAELAYRETLEALEKQVQAVARRRNKTRPA